MADRAQGAPSSLPAPSDARTSQVELRLRYDRASSCRGDPHAPWTPRPDADAPRRRWLGTPEALPAWPPPPPPLPRALPPPRMLERMPRAGPSPVPLKEPWLAQQPPSPPLQSPPRHELRPVCPRRPVSKSLVRLSSSGPKRMCCAPHSTCPTSESACVPDEKNM